MSNTKGPLDGLIFGYRYVEKNGTVQNQHDTINLIGFTIADNPSNGSTDVTSDLTAATGVLPVASGGTGLAAPGTTGNVLTSNGTVWTSAAPSGGGGSPAGATNDIQINDAGSFGADTGNFAFNPSDHSFIAGLGNAASGDGAAAFGAGSAASGTGAFAAGQGAGASIGPSIALGYNCDASNFAAVAIGEQATASRPGQYAFTSWGSAAVAQDKCVMGLTTNAGATSAVNLTQNDASEFEFESGKAYSLTVTVQGVDTAGNFAHEVHILKVVDIGGFAAIQRDGLISDALDQFSTQSWACTISIPGGETLRITCDPLVTGATCNFAATVEWKEIVIP